MLRITQSKSAQQAKSYYVGGLSREEYYSEEQEIAGKWHGKGAERLGLAGNVDQEAFYALSENRDPATGARLTARINDDRTIGYDFSFHVPKSVSAMYAHTRDERIVEAMREAVGDTMREIETEMKTRIRIGGVQGERMTGNLVYAEFIHKTARPVNGKPDPHLHAHCFVFNATFDNVEERWKAGYFRDLKRDAPYHEAAFHARMADGMKQLGYGVEAKGKFWEIDGVPQSVIDKYSQRRDQIEALAEERGITDPAALDKLGASSREKKVKLSMEQLSAEWTSRLTPEEKAAMEAARAGGRSKQTGKEEIGQPTQRALDHALDHVFERVSVSSAKEVQEQALRYGVGKVTVDQIKAAFENDPRIINRVVEGERRCTTWEVRDQEKKIVAFAKETRGTLDPIKLGPHEFGDLRLNEKQRAAVEHVLSSRDQVTMIRGGAGVGKTTLMREAITAMGQAGYFVVPLAPSADASRGVLREEAGLPNANTLESFLINPNLQKQMAGQVLWVDEGSLMSARMSERLLNVAKANACRIIIAGDTAQHHSVERGDIMRLLEKHAGLPVAEVQSIIRQTGEYKEAVENVRAGKLEAAFATLEKMGAIKESPDIGALHQQLAEDYVSLLKDRKKVLIVSPQHQEINAVTKAVREKLREAGKLNGEEYTFTRLSNLQLTEAQRGDPRSYAPGQVVQFTQHAAGFRRGERAEVLDRTGDKVLIQTGDGATKELPLKQSKHFHLYKAEPIALAAGDRIRVTQNSFAKGRQRLNNGGLYNVARITPEGEILLKNGAVLPKKFGHLTHGYCVTSYASQSKTVNVPLIAQSSLSFNASSLEQIYVSLSRGNEGIRIYTDDLKELRERVARTTARGSAMDFTGELPKEKYSRAKADIPVEMRRAWRSWERRKEKAVARSYEREIGKPLGASKGGKGDKGRDRGLELTIGI
jgi:conjugative relaxase-like TrwC/TraI family protein